MKIFPRQKNKTKFRFEVLCGIWCRFQNCPCFFLALIVYDFSSFEGSKIHFTGKANVYIYIYIYIYIMIAILSNIRRFDAINASNQRTICSCMIFQPLCFKLAIFSINSIVFYEIFYNDVTASCDFIMTSHICSPIMMKFVQHTYVKLNSKHNLFVRIFYLRFIFRDNYDYRFYIYTYIVALMQ